MKSRALDIYVNNDYMIKNNSVKILNYASSLRGLSIPEKRKWNSSRTTLLLLCLSIKTF